MMPCRSAGGAVSLEVQDAPGIGPAVNAGRSPSLGAEEATCVEAVYLNQYLTPWWCEQVPWECREYDREASLHFAVSYLSFGL